MSEARQIYDKNNMYHAAIIERYKLCSSESDKNVEHVVLSLKNSGLSYTVGDSIAVGAENDPEIVERTLKAMGASGDEIVTDKHGEHTYVLREFFTKKANLADVSKKMVVTLSEKQTDAFKKLTLQTMLEEAHKDVLKEYQRTHEIWDLLEENREVKFTPQELCNLLMPLLPRFYSIASAQSVVGEEVHLTVAELVYETNGHTRRGVATHYLCKLAPMNHSVVPIYIHPSNGFTLPADQSAPIIMIGPGTGVAPYRGFMQERIKSGATGSNWLFFGERHRAHEYLYGEYWEKLAAEGALRVDNAFSRDQEHKIYVQHKMLEHGKEFFDQLENGAYVYVCGDAHKMAKDVDAALHDIVRTYGGYDEHRAKEYVKALKAAKRYLRDVY